jgi:hypothetical protein
LAIACNKRKELKKYSTLLLNAFAKSFYENKRALPEGDLPVLFVENKIELVTGYLPPFLCWVYELNFWVIFSKR